MAYVPIDDGDFRSPVAANSALWSTLIANDAECYALYEPGLEATPKLAASGAPPIPKESRIRRKARGMSRPQAVTCASTAADSPDVSPTA